MDNIQSTILFIFSLSVGGVSILTILADVIYCVKSIKKMRKAVKKNEQDILMSKEDIEQAFKDAVLPKTIKLDVSSKIEKPIKEGMTQMMEYNAEALIKIHEENVLILKVLNEFTHVKKLSDEDQEKIADIINEEVTEEVTL